MRSANQQDIENIQKGGDVPYEVMFWMWRTQKLVHRKTLYNPSVLKHKEHCLVETADGTQAIITNPLYELQAIPKKQGSPKKVKKPHVKGSKPWLGYDSKRIVNGVNGVKVKVRNGDVYIVDFSNVRFDDSYLHLQSFDINTGKNKYNKMYDIIRILDNNNAQEIVAKKAPEYFTHGDVFEIGDCFEFSHIDNYNVVVMVTAVGDNFTLLTLRNYDQKLKTDSGAGRYWTAIKLTTLVYAEVDNLLSRYDTNWKYLGKFADVYTMKKEI